MTNSLFEATRPGTRVTRGTATFDLPILYFRDDCFSLFYSADLAELRRRMPSDRLHPVSLGGGRGVVGIVAFNYIDTSIGMYGEVGVAVPVVYGRRPLLPVMPLLREASQPGFGALVLHLPVTTRAARDAGRGEWGYTKFVSDMEFQVGPERLECRLSEEGRHILTLRVERRGVFLRDRKPVITYSVKEQHLIRTTIPQRGTCRVAIRPAGSSVELGDHPVAESIRSLRLGPRPILSRYYVERSAVLPSGDVVEEGVRPLDGFEGTDREEGRLTVRYPPETGEAKDGR